MAEPNAPVPGRFKAFAGIRNTVSPERFGPADLVAAVNVDIDDTGRIARKKGYSLLSATGTKWLYANGDLLLGVQGSGLMRLANDLTPLATLRTVTASQRMSYWTVIGRTYFSNGLEVGCVENGVARTWGMVPPSSIGVAASTPGGLLPAGRYQWTLTYLRGDGQESGTRLSGIVTLAEQAGIAWSSLPVSSDPDVAGKIVYLTTVNGDKFYEALILAAADTTATYMGDGVEFTRELETWLCQEAPAGQCVSYFRGQTLVAAGTVLYPSVPYGYELFDLRNYFDFESAITLIAPVEDGLFVCTQTHHYWLPGLSQADWTQQVKTDVGAIPGSLVYTDGQKVGEGIGGMVALWLARSGICIGANGGVFKVLTADRVNANIARSEGASVVIDNRVITTAE